MTDNTKREKGLTQLAEDIENEQKKILEIILFMAALKQKGLMNSLPYRYDFKPGFSDSIINILAELLISKHLKKDNSKVISEAFSPLMQHIKIEIDKIYMAIKAIGFAGRLGALEEKWRKAALDAFDDSRKGFQAIRREHLEDENLYFFGPGKEKRDFEEKLLIKIFYDLDLGKYGGRTLRNI